MIATVAIFGAIPEGVQIRDTNDISRQGRSSPNARLVIYGTHKRDLPVQINYKSATVRLESPARPSHAQWLRGACLARPKGEVPAREYTEYLTEIEYLC